MSELSFTAPAVDDGTITRYEFEANETTVLAFFPGAFTGPCTEEMCSFQENLTDFEDLDATVIAISVDTPFAQQEFAEQNDLTFLLISDTDTTIAEQYNVKTTFPDTGHAIAKRAVFIIQDGTIVYEQIMDDPHTLPDMDDIKEELQAVRSA